MKAPHGWSEIAAFYKLDTFQGQADIERHMVLVKAPPGASFFFDRDADGMQDADESMRGIRVHPQIADGLVSCLLEIRAAGLWRFIQSCSGGYTSRLQKGSLSKISMHALGAAIDFDPLRNPLGADLSVTTLGTEPGRGVVRIFERQGWTWGGDFPRRDSMHVQYGSGY